MSFRETAKRFNQMLQIAERRQLTHLVDLLRWLTTEVKGAVCYEQFREPVQVFSLYSWYQVKQNMTGALLEGAPDRFKRLLIPARVELMQKLFGTGVSKEFACDECDACAKFYASLLSEKSASDPGEDSIPGLRNDTDYRMTSGLINPELYGVSEERRSSSPVDTDLIPGLRNDTDYRMTSGLINPELYALSKDRRSGSSEVDSEENARAVGSVSFRAASGTAASGQRPVFTQRDQGVQTESVKSVWRHAVQVGAASFVLGMFSQAAVQSLVDQSDYATQLLSMCLTRSMQLPQGGSADRIKSLLGAPILIFLASSFLIGVGALVGYTQAPSIEKIPATAGLRK